MKTVQVRNKLVMKVDMPRWMINTIAFVYNFQNDQLVNYYFNILLPFGKYLSLPAICVLDQIDLYIKACMPPI